MSILNDRQIIEHNGFVDPFDIDLVQPASIDVRLGPSGFGLVALPLSDYISVGYDKVNYIPTTNFLFPPGRCALWSTMETVTLPDNIAAEYCGTSSLGRLFLQSHMTAAWIDPGFHGKITLEIKNSGPFPLMLEAGMIIGQLIFHELNEPALRPYGSEGLGSRYQNATGVEGYKLKSNSV